MSSTLARKRRRKRCVGEENTHTQKRGGNAGMLRIYGWFVKGDVYVNMCSNVWHALVVIRQSYNEISQLELPLNLLHIYLL